MYVIIPTLTVNAKIISVFKLWIPALSIYATATITNVQTNGDLIATMYLLSLKLIKLLAIG
ncbi:hypothetical protein DSLASN_02990 [Desulfoluna limicola]|uniref:Uncharacterized protein n=1 Tax=Desulfoluna limicola TaxID=2810562 RepID=A0ABN6EZK3_9BACT|nr:hypothetical protein DSLASN_02990 [Desulfoluna limicola]